jgi:hypothetical protein
MSNQTAIAQKTADLGLLSKYNINLAKKLGFSIFNGGDLSQLFMLALVNVVANKRREYPSPEDKMQPYLDFADLLAREGANIRMECLDPFAPQDSARPIINALLLAIGLGDEQRAIKYLHQGVIAADSNHGLNNPLVLAIKAGMGDLAAALLKPEKTPERHRAAHEKALIEYMTRVAVVSWDRYSETMQEPLTTLAELPIEQEALYQRVWKLYREKAEWMLENALSKRIAYDFQIKNMVFDDRRASLKAAVAHDRLEQVQWQVEKGAPINGKYLGYDSYYGDKYTDTLLHMAIRSKNTNLALWAIKLDAERNAESPLNSILCEWGSGGTNRGAQHPLEMAVKSQQWEVVEALLASPVKHFQKYLHLKDILHTIYHVEEQAIKKPEDAEAQNASSRLRKASPSLKESLLRDIDEWASDDTLNGTRYSEEPGAFHWVVAIGDMALIEACLGQGASALHSGNTYPVYEALKRYDTPSTNPDMVQPSRQEIFEHLHRAALQQLPDVDTRRQTEVRQILGNTMIEAVLNHSLPQVAIDYLNAGVGVRSKHSDLKLTLLHAAIVAKDRAQDEETRDLYDVLIKTVLEESQQQDQSGQHKDFVNQGGFFDSFSASLAQHGGAAVGYNANGTIIEFGGKGYTPVRLAVMSDPVDLKTLALLQKHGADIELPIKEWEKLGQAVRDAYPNATQETSDAFSHLLLAQQAMAFLPASQER